MAKFSGALNGGAADEGGLAMAFDEMLAARVRKSLTRLTAVKEKRMFGGLAFLYRGNMCVGVHGNELIVRLAPDDAERVLVEANVREFALTGRPVKGWLLVASTGLATDAQLKRWVDGSVGFVASLPAKA
jgi:TfoX/Sxy family transcriptional regulator of competence genes